MTLALTGGTGFVGQAVLDLLEDSGERVRVLARKVPENRRGFRWVDGSLHEPFKLAHLVADADAYRFGVGDQLVGHVLVVKGDDHFRAHHSGSNLGGTVDRSALADL